MPKSPAIPAKQEAADEQEQMHGPPKQTEHAAPKIDDDDVRFFLRHLIMHQKMPLEITKRKWQRPVTAETADEEVADSRMSKFFSLFNRDKGSREDAETRKRSSLRSRIIWRPRKNLRKAFIRWRSAQWRRFLFVFSWQSLHFWQKAGTSLPFGIGSNLLLLTGILLIMLLIVMILGIDLLIKGLADLFTAEPGGRIARCRFMCCHGAVAAFYTILTKNDEFGLPFLRGGGLVSDVRHVGRTDLPESNDSDRFGPPSQQRHPYGVSVQYGQLGQRTILKKDLSRTEGFYNNLVQADVCERTYTYAAPLLLIAALLFAILASIGRGMPQNFAHSFAAIISISASFSVLLAFPLPFSTDCQTCETVRRSHCRLGGSLRHLLF